MRTFTEYLHVKNYRQNVVQNMNICVIFVEINFLKKAIEGDLSA